MKLGIILTSDNRSKAYLQKMIDNKIQLDEIIFMNNNEMLEVNNEIIQESIKNGFDISKSIKEILEKNNLKFIEFPFVDINNIKIIDCVKNSNVDYFIFSGGGILKSDILQSGKKFVHFHPGIVPEYRGSTCFYYSIINEENCGVTAFIMDEGLDTGNIIYQRTFKKPKNIYIDEVFDAHIRSETLIDVLKKELLLKNINKAQNPDNGNTYFIIHPVLKHIAILDCIKN